MDPLTYFQFSQSSLQDFVDCQRRFQLRYMQHIAWPAIQAEPARENERHIQRGERFHRLAQQYLLGMPEAKLTRMAEADEDEHLCAWWHNFLDCVPVSLLGQRHVEVTLSAPLGCFRVVAKYDLVLIRPNGRVVIYDWKTSLRRPKRERLLERLQTRIYPYLLIEAGAALNHGCAFEPEQVEMVYWFADPTQPPEHIAYTFSRWQEDQRYLHNLVGQVQSLTGGGFSMAVSDKACAYCVYRSLCDRGTQAVDFQIQPDGYDPEAAENLDFGLEQIGEIRF